MNRSVTFGAARPESNARADVAAFQRWMVAVCAIRFDLQQGQVCAMLSSLKQRCTSTTSRTLNLKSSRKWCHFHVHPSDAFRCQSTIISLGAVKGLVGL